MSPSPNPLRIGWWKHLFREARRRRVPQVAAAYVGLFFVLAQAASIFFPALQLPDYTVTWFVAVGILGFPLAVGLAWAFDLTREGIVRAPPFRRAGPSRAKGFPSVDAPLERPDEGGLAPRDWKEIYRVLTDAVELSPGEREAFVQRELAGGPHLVREVEALLRFHDATGPMDRLESEVMGPLVRPVRAAVSGATEGNAHAPALSDAAGEREEKLLAGRYEVGEELGRGGMGVVHRARDVRLDREVALKFLPAGPGTGNDGRRRFLQEARAAAALDHPNICTIHEIGESPEGGLFIAMPLYRGRSLGERLAGGPLRWEEALDVALQTARGLACAHEAGIVHRDVKPANLYLTDEGVVKILDFGIAKVADATLSALGTVLGTASYMSPEQARGERVDHRSDLWSLGVVLYEMLTGRRLFASDDQDSVVAAIRGDAPLPLGRLRGTAPAPFLRVVEKLLVRPPEERPPSAEAVIQLLDEAGRAPRVDSEETGAEEVALAPEGERRQATVVVARVVGYADLLERLEPAELEGRMARLEASVQDVARRHGGIMNEFAADRFSLVFGLPRTHEDDVLRAVRSTLELQSLSELGAEREGGKPLALRVGVATGTLVVRPAGNSSRVYQLAGAPPERAERLCTEAAPGEAWVDPPSHRAAEPYFDLEAAGTLPVGVDGASVEVGRVTAGRTGKAPTDSGRLELARLTPYAGREAELTLLEVAFQKVLGGEGRFATVIGEAGIGKSRLILEFRRRAKEGSARVLHGHCQPYADGGPYHPFVQVLHQVLGMDGANLLVDEESIAGRVEKVDPALGRYLPFYLHLLSVPGTRHSLPRGLEGEQLRAGIRESLIALVTLACDEAPIVLTLEDWHWADEASGELLKQLVGVLDPHPLFVIVTARPGYGAEWDSSLPRLLVHLTALDLEESSQVLEALLGVDEVAEELANTLHERSGGNPFFLEELTHSLREAGMLRVEEGRAELSGTSDGMHLPTTIQGVIRTRLDRIPAETREVLRSAAVLGREFSLPLLERIGLDRYALERAVKHLTEAGVLQQIQVVPEPRFRFRHALTQEVAYDTLLHHQRTSLHERAGRALVELYPERLSEEAPALARHFSRAERWREAVRYGVVAAERARELSEFADALQTLQEVEGWLARLPGDRWRRELEAELLLEEEELCETLGLRGRQEELLDRLEALAKAGVGEGSEPTEEDRALRAEIQRRRGDLYTLLRRYEEAEEVLEAARELARETGDPKLQGSVLRSSGLAAWHGGELERALEWIDEALALARERGDADAMIGDLNNKAQILKDRGDHRTALACLEEALQLLDESPSEPRRAYTLHIMSNQHRALGNQDRALELLTEASRITREQHLPMSRCFHLTAIAHIHLTRGRLEEAVDTYREAVASAREARYAEGLARSLHPLGELLAAIGREEEALSYLEEAARIFAQLGQSRTEADALEKVAEVGTRVGDWERVHDAWQACLRRSETLNDPEVRVRALEGLARAQRELGAEPRVVRGSLEEALQVAREQGDRRREAGILNSLGILEWRQGAYRAALERYERALEIFRDLDDPVHEGLILNSLGVTLRAMGRTAEARAHLEKALEVHRSTGQSLLEGHALAALAEVHLEEEEPDAARDCFGRSLEIRRSIGDRAGEAWMLHGLARVEALLGGTAAAEERLAEVRRIAGELEDGELVQACEELRP